MLDNLQGKKVTVIGLGLYKKGSGIEAVKFFLRQGASVTVTDLRSAQDLKESVEEAVRYYNKLPKFITPPTSPYLKGRDDRRPSLRVRGGRGSYESGDGTRKLTFILGKHREEDFKNADIIFQNPSVPADSPYLRLAHKRKIPVVNDWSLFLARHVPKMFIGVTGTRGKSTTTALIYEMLKKEHRTPSWPPPSRGRKQSDIPLPRWEGRGEGGKGQGKVWLAGNLGVSPLNFIDTYKGEPIVAELSSWLLHHFPAAKKSPNIAVITNIMNDHMDKYRNFQEYVADKENIFKFQRHPENRPLKISENDPQPIVVLNYDNPYTRAMARRARGKVLWFSLKKRVPRWVPLEKILLQGEHNKENALAAALAAEAANVSRVHIMDVLKTFRGLPNRLQLVRTVRGVQYYNDTTATTPDATIAAVKTLGSNPHLTAPIKGEEKGKNFPPLVGGARGGGQRIVLIAGGADKKLDYREMAGYMKKYCKAVVLLPGSATKKLESGIRNQELEIVKVRNMKSAVQKAFSIAKRGDIVLLSPAAASFGLFLNEFDRGEQFVAQIKKL